MQCSEYLRRNGTNDRSYKPWEKKKQLQFPLLIKRQYNLPVLDEKQFDMLVNTLIAVKNQANCEVKGYGDAKVLQTLVSYITQNTECSSK